MKKSNTSTKKHIKGNQLIGKNHKNSDQSEVVSRSVRGMVKTVRFRHPEVCRVWQKRIAVESAKNGVVGSGNYWVTFVARSQFVMIRCLSTLILKEWRPLRLGVSSSIDGGRAFLVPTYSLGITEQSLSLIALAGQGRAETNGSRRAGVLFLGCPPVSVGQEAEVGAWLGDDRSAACTEGTGH